MTQNKLLTPEQRDKLIDDYAWRVVDEMDLRELCRLMAKQFSSKFNEYTDEQLIEKIQDLFPDLLLKIK